MRKVFVSYHFTIDGGSGFGNSVIEFDGGIKSNVDLNVIKVALELRAATEDRKMAKAEIIILNYQIMEK